MECTNGHSLCTVSLAYWHTQICKYFHMLQAWESCVLHVFMFDLAPMYICILQWHSVWDTIQCRPLKMFFVLHIILKLLSTSYFSPYIYLCMYFHRFSDFLLSQREVQKARGSARILQYSSMKLVCVSYHILTHAYTYLQISLVVAVAIVLSLLSLSLLPLSLLSEEWGLMCGFSITFMTFGNEEMLSYSLCYINSV